MLPVFAGSHPGKKRAMIFLMNTLTLQPALIVPVDKEHARMMGYALSLAGQKVIAQAQAEIDAGKGIVADDAYFQSLKERRAKLRMAR